MTEYEQDLPEQDYYEDRKFLGVWIPAGIFYARDISSKQKMLWADIEYLGRKHGCYTSNKGFSDKYGVTERCIMKNLKVLKDSGYIETIRFDGRKRFLKTTNKGRQICPPPPDSPVQKGTKVHLDPNKRSLRPEQTGTPLYNIRKHRENIENGYMDIKYFEKLWNKYPSTGRVGKKHAIKHFNKTVKTKCNWEDINTALDNYLRCKRVKNGFVKNGSTWFNEWEDWINWKESDSGEPQGASRMLL